MKNPLTGLAIAALALALTAGVTPAAGPPVLRVIVVETSDVDAYVEAMERGHRPAPELELTVIVVLDHISAAARRDIEER